MKTMCRGFKKEFIDGFVLDELLADNRLTIPQLIEDITETLSRKK